MSGGRPRLFLASPSLALLLRPPPLPREGGGPVWTEGVIVVLALAALVAALTRRSMPGVDRRLLGFFGFYAVLMVVAYVDSLQDTLVSDRLPSRAGSARGGRRGESVRCRPQRPRTEPRGRVPRRRRRAPWLAGVGREFSLRGRPSQSVCVRAHQPRCVRNRRRVEQLALAHPQRLGMPIDIVSRENLWPLPWYFRRFSAR